MSAPKLSLREVKKLRPCKADLPRVETYMPRTGRITAAQAVRRGATLDDLMWVAEARADADPDVLRRLRMWGADCAARVLSLYESSAKSQAPRAAIIAARQFANGEIDEAAREAAGDVALAAARAAASDEEAWQLKRLVEWLSEKEPEPYPLPEPRRVAA